MVSSKQPLTLDEMKLLPKDQQKEIISRIKAVRKKAKVVTYSAMYGVGAAKLAREIRSNKKEAQVLLDGFWKLNWAIKAVADKAEIKVTGPHMWLRNPTSGFWHSLRYAKDSWSTLNQSTGVFCFDTWLFYVRQAGVEINFQFHDEEGHYVVAGNEEQNTLLLKEAIGKANDKLKLNVPLDIDVKYGNNYAETH